MRDQVRRRAVRAGVVDAQFRRVSQAQRDARRREDVGRFVDPRAVGADRDLRIRRRLDEIRRTRPSNACCSSSTPDWLARPPVSASEPNDALAGLHHAECRASVATRQDCAGSPSPSRARGTADRPRRNCLRSSRTARMRRCAAAPAMSVVLDVRRRNRRTFDAAAAEVVDEAVFPIREYLAVDSEAAAAEIAAARQLGRRGGRLSWS